MVTDVIGSGTAAPEEHAGDHVGGEMTSEPHVEDQEPNAGS